MDDLLCPTLVQRERSVKGGRVVPMANGATLYVSNHSLQMLAINGIIWYDGVTFRLTDNDEWEPTVLVS